MKKRTSFFTISSILIVLILCFLIRVLWITRTNSSLRARDLDFKLNFEKYWAYGNANVITLSTLTVGKWSTMYLNNQYGPVFKVNSTHVLMVRGSGNDQVLYYLKINDDDKSASSDKNATFSYGGVTYKSNADARVYRPDNQTFCKFGDYAILFIGAGSNYLRCGEWVSGTSNWRYYDRWGLTNQDITDRDNGFPLSEAPTKVYGISVDSNTHLGELSKNNVTRKIRKISVNDVNATITDHPFVFNVSNNTSYRFWVDSSTRTTIPNKYVYDSVEEHIIWPEYNKNFTGDNYTSGNVGADINNVGTYVVNGKKVDVNLRVTFYWQTAPVRLSYKMENAYNHKTNATTTYTFNTFPRFVGIKVSKNGHRLGLPATGTPYRAKMDFFYTDGSGEHTLAINGSFGFEDIDGNNYIAVKPDSGATIDEVQFIEDNYSWIQPNFTGKGSINTISLGLNAKDNSGVYDVICTNPFTNASNAQATASGEYDPERPNYARLTSGNGFESRAVYKISNVKSINAIVGGHGQHEYGKRYFNSIFDVPNIFSQVIANHGNNIYGNYAVEYAKKDTDRDVTTNTFHSMGCINISGVQLGRNAIPIPTVMLEDDDEEEEETIVINRDQNGGFKPYTEVVRIKIPYEEKYSINSVTYDNYYDSFKIEQQLEPGISLDLSNNREINIHYLGETDNLASTYFTTSYDSPTHKIEITANSAGNNSIYKQSDFYECELVVEIPLAVTASIGSGEWNNSTKPFPHKVGLTVGRVNTNEYGIEDELETKYSEQAIAYIEKNDIPTPTVKLTDFNEPENDNILINRNQGGLLNSYTEVIRVMIPYEDKSTVYDNYYDSFKIEQVLEEGITPNLANVKIHYLDDTTDLTTDNFTISYDSPTHIIELIANSNGDSSIYRQSQFYNRELVVEIPLDITLAYNDAIWNNTDGKIDFSHIVSLSVERSNQEYDSVPNENVTNTSTGTIFARVYVATINIKHNDILWELDGNDTTDMMKVALYANGIEEYSFSDGIVINNNSAIRWIGIDNKTYNIYASKNSNEITTLVDTGITITMNNIQ